MSQVIFSSSAVVHFELLVGRDAKSMDFFSSGGSSTASMGPPGKLHELWPPGSKGEQVVARKGIFSPSVTLRVDDTSSLWNSPALPKKGTQITGRAEGTEGTAEDQVGDVVSGVQQLNMQSPVDADADSADITAPATPTAPPAPTKKKIHLVVLTHGLHSNLGADMLYLKESIDAAMNKRDADGNPPDEQVIVRGFSGNAVRTERGIQYLGKRLAKYVLLMTYPDQPYFPLKGSKSNPFTRPFGARKDAETKTPSLEPQSQPETREDPPEGEDHAYQITSISFVGHSLGGLIQTYAIAYIQKHSPEFFTRIQPINFIALATPFLGLSNENPMYVRFALDFGLVGRTGQDLGLSWTAPKVRSGWGAIIGGRGDSSKDQRDADPGAKPLLRILPCGPAHEVLKKFHHRTLYSNVVNDGIVPLRTSCLLFLDWRGLDRVEKARRGNGIVGTMAEWGWAELTGANSKSPKLAQSEDDLASSLQGREAIGVNGENSPNPEQFLARRPSQHTHHSAMESISEDSGAASTSNSAFSSFLSLFRPKETNPSQKHSTPSGKHEGKNAKIYKRSQTLGSFDTEESPGLGGSGSGGGVRGNSLYEEDVGVYTPPKTTFFESAGDLLMPPLPPSEFILDPSARSRTIFHDRIYHPDDIPHPLPVKRRTIAFGSLQNKSTNSKTVPQNTQLGPGPGGSGSASGPGQEQQGAGTGGASGLKVEEKIARAYHRDITWRKVLVRLEPDAHNNIIVRRMFTNAYGWPVVKHLVDTHFAAEHPQRDELNSDSERAKALNVGPTSSGDEVEQSHQHGEQHGCENSQQHEDQPEFDQHDFQPEGSVHSHGRTHSHYTDVSRQDSARWTDRQIDEDDDCDSGLEGEIGYRSS